MKKQSFTLLSAASMETIAGASAECVTGGVNAAVTGFCTIGSFFNPFVAVGCAGYGVYQLFACQD